MHTLHLARTRRFPAPAAAAEGTETGPLATAARQGRNWSESSGIRVAWRQPTCSDREGARVAAGPPWQQPGRVRVVRKPAGPSSLSLA